MSDLNFPIYRSFQSPNDVVSILDVRNKFNNPNSQTCNAIINSIKTPTQLLLLQQISLYFQKNMTQMALLAVLHETQVFL
jgi:hypothetical protein